MMRKFLFFLHQTFIIALENRIRFFLTIVGVFIAVFVFCTGKIISDSYYQSQMRIIDSYYDHVVQIESDWDYDKTASFLGFDNNSNGMTCTFLNNPKTVLSEQLEDGYYVNVMADIAGLSYGVYRYRPTKNAGIGTIPIETTLVKGRFFDSSDYSSGKKVAVITKLIEDTVFDGDAVGKTIYFFEGENGTSVSYLNEENTTASLVTSFEVIGVVSDSVQDVNERHRVLKILDKEEKNSISILSSVYIPDSVMNSFSIEEKEKLFFFQLSQADYSEYCSNLDKILETHTELNGVVTFNYYEKSKASVEASLSDLRVILYLVTMILLIISSLSIMGIMLFAVKERIPEIGIRKAFGAYGIDVTFQLTLEMVFIGLIGAVVASVLSGIVCKQLEPFLINTLFSGFVVVVSPEHILLAILIGVTEAFICSLIPCMYASRIKVTDAMRFE